MVLVERRPLRLRMFDYSSAGLYFVTTCTRGRECSLGSVENESVSLSLLGAVARDRLSEIPLHHVTVTVDLYVVMPNHVHVLLGLHDRHEVELGDVVGTYKAAVSRSARRRRIWQRVQRAHRSGRARPPADSGVHRHESAPVGS